MLWLEGMLPAEEGAALESALGKRAEDVPRTRTPPIPPGPDWPMP